MITRKLKKGLYEAIDVLYNNYRVEDSSRAGAWQRPHPFNKLGKGYKWGIWEQVEGEWEYLDGNKTFSECIVVIRTWAAASQLGKES